ncbi:hypothetical protein Tco_0356456 [Tanacetum coccineum]
MVVLIRHQKKQVKLLHKCESFIRGWGYGVGRGVDYDALELVEELPEVEEKRKDEFHARYNWKENRS